MPVTNTNSTKANVIQSSVRSDDCEGAALAKETRVAILFQRFGPYHHARLNAAARLMSVIGVEACAMEDIYAWDKVEGAAAFKRITLTERDSGDRKWRQELHRNMWKTLDEIKPQVVVVPGWSFVDALSALLWCAANQVPSVVMSESTSWDEQRVASKEWVKNRLVRLNSAGLAGGTPHAEYLVQLGLERDRIFVGYDVVDNDHFQTGADDARQQADKLRKDHGLPEKFFLASARFIEKKNLFRLVQAFARYRSLAGENEAWSLVLLGDGPLKPDLCRLIAELGIESSVHLPGFKQYDELPVYFGLAGAFVHASTTEQWGLVVNEAMAAGLPVLVSHRCGCAEDLVLPEVNGFQFDPGNVEDLARLLLKVSANGFPLQTFGDASRRTIAAWGPARFASGMQEAVAAAISHPRPPASWFDRALLRLLLQK